MKIFLKKHLKKDKLISFLKFIVSYITTQNIINIEKKIKYMLERNLFVNDLNQNINFNYNLFSDKIYCLHMVDILFIIGLTGFIFYYFDKDMKNNN